METGCWALWRMKATLRISGVEFIDGAAQQQSSRLGALLLAFIREIGGADCTDR